MREIHQQNQSKQEEQDGSDECDIVSPNFKERVRDEESDDNQAQPSDYFRSPKAVLNRCAAVFRAVHSQKKYCMNGVETAEGEVHAVNGGEPEALFTGAVDGDIVEEDALELLDGPVGHGEP